jgi:hypothetical protein
LSEVDIPAHTSTTNVSLRAQKIYGFDSLFGHTVTFLVDGRRTNLALAKSMLSHLVKRSQSCIVLDVDALYASNSDYIFGPLSDDDVQRIELLVPEAGSNLRDEIGQLLGIDAQRVLVIDSLNSVFHLLPAERHGSRNRGLAFVLSLLSYLARVEGRTTFLTMYQRGAGSGGKNPISELSDLTINVTLTDGVLTLKGNGGNRINE